MLAFIAGIFIGSVVTLFTMSLMAAAKRGDQAGQMICETEDC